MQSQKLFMLLLGCTPPGRHIEQHDIFFAIGTSLTDIKEQIITFWPEANGKIHIDAWREINAVDGYRIQVTDKNDVNIGTPEKLFFLNLGGYKKNEFDELHYKMLVVANEKSVAIKSAKETAFYKHTGFEGAASHIDDKYGVDVDDIFEITEILSKSTKQKFSLKITRAENLIDDEMHLGYFVLSKL